MQQQERGLVVVHHQPVWRERANSVFHMLVGVHDGRSRWEQLWWQRTTAGLYTLCCVPFLIDDLALGDEVETNECLVVRRIVQRSGQVTFRVRIDRHDPWVRDHILRITAALEPLAEWSAPNLLALSVDEAQAGNLRQRLKAFARRKPIEFATGRIDEVAVRSRRAPSQR